MGGRGDTRRASGDPVGALAPAATLAVTLALALGRPALADEPPATDPPVAADGGGARAPGPARPGHGQPHPTVVRGLEYRVQLLTKELGLDEGQQVAVRRVLEGQRDQVLKVWSDPTIAPAERPAAVRIITDRTADQIRALLNDEQKKKYNQPSPPPPAAEGGRSVAEWMDALHGPSPR